MDSLSVECTQPATLHVLREAATRLPLVNEPDRDPLLESEVPWQTRVVRSRAFAWLEMCRPTTGTWLLFSSALMVLTAAEGSLEWGLPFQYSGMIVAFAYTAALIGNALDAQIDATTRLMRPIPAGKISSRGSLIAAAVPF